MQVRYSHRPLAARGRILREAKNPVEASLMLVTSCLTDRPDERRLAAGLCLHAHADMAAAAGCEPRKQAFENLGTGRMIIGHIGHQLPARLPDVEATSGLC